MATQQQQRAVQSGGLEAIIFDVDGTLADTELRGHFVAYNRVFAALDLPWRWDEDEYRRLLEITGGGERLRHYLHNEQVDFACPDGDRDAFALKLHQLKNDCYQQLVVNNAVPLRPGVKRLINEARANGLRLAIATASHPDNVRVLLEHTLGSEAKDWFEVIAGGSDVKAKKPAPDIYQHVLAKLGLPENSVVVIEDSEQGLKAALTTGLKTLVTTNHFTKLQDFSGAAAVTDHLGDPNQPCHIRGDEGGRRMVDVAMLRELTNPAAAATQ